MSLRRTLVATVGIGFVIFVGPATGLTPAPLLPLSVGHIDISGYPTVEAVVTAPQAPANSITAASFRVVEANTVRPFKVERLPTSELAVVLVIDTSGSMRGAALSAAERAATSFVETMPAGVPVAVVGFANAPKVQSAFTTDRAASVRALASLRASGNTTLYDAILKGVALHAERPQGPKARKVMVVLTDGGDTRSVASLSEASAALGSSGISMSAISLATSESDLASLSVLAASAGGKVVAATDPAALKGVFRGISDSVLNQYALKWTAGSYGPTSVSIDLKINDAQYQSIQAVGFPSRSTIVPSSPKKPPSIQANSVPTVTRAGDGRSMLLFGIGAGFASLLCVAGVLLWPRVPRSRLASEFGKVAAPEFSNFTKRILAATDRSLGRSNRQRRLQLFLERAGIKTDPANAVVFSVVVSVIAFAMGIAIGGLGLALVLAVASVGALYAFADHRAERRCDLFQEQFESTLQIISNSLKAGYGISQAIDTVAKESDAPTSEEFRRVVQESRLGMDQITALEACAHRVKCDDLLWITDAIAVNRDVGGNLTEVFAGVSATLRARTRLARQVKALSAEGRISARILISLPFFVTGWMFLVNRSYVQNLFTGIGAILLACAGVLMTIGYFWTRRIIRVEY